MSLLSDIQDRLAANLVGTPGHDLHLSDMPGEGEILYDEATETSAECPVEVIALYEDPAGPGVHAKDGQASRASRLRVIVRAETHEAAMARAMLVYGLLAHNAFVAAGGALYSTREASGPFDLGARDGNGRHLVSTNYDVKIA